MKRFGVAGYLESSITDFGYANRELLRAINQPGVVNGMGYHEIPKRGVEWDGNHYSHDILVYWSDSFADAEALAKVLSEKQSGRSFVAFEAKLAFTSTPKPPVKSLFTDRGVVPAT